MSSNKSKIFIKVLEYRSIDGDDFNNAKVKLLEEVAKYQELKSPLAKSLQKEAEDSIKQLVEIFLKLNKAYRKLLFNNSQMSFRKFALV